MRQQNLCVKTVLLMGKWLIVLQLSALLAACSFTPPLIERERSVAPVVGIFTEVDCAHFQSNFDTTFKCGYVHVPADHLQSASGQVTQLQLAVVIAKATAPERQPDPIIMLPDGPGAPVIDQVSAFQPMVDSGAARERDVVWFDPRGVGFSWPSLSCYEEMNPFVESILRTPPDDAATYFDRYATAVQSCFARWRSEDIDFAHYTTVQNAHDVLAVAQALGYDHFNLRAWGYGTRVALNLLHNPAAEGRVRSVVLIAPNKTDANPLEIPAQLASRIDMLLNECAAAADCQEAFPNLRQQYEELLAKLATTPDQVTIEWNNETLSTQADETTLLNYFLEAFSFGSLSIEEAPETLTALVAGETTPMAGTVILLTGLEYWAPYLAVQCQDVFLKLSPDAITEVKAKVPPALTDFAQRHPAFSWRLPELCATLNLTPTATQDSSTVQAAVPLLVFSGAYDPLLSPTGYTSELVGFEQVYTYEVKNAGRFPIPGLDSCVDTMAASFVSNPSQRPDSTCLDTETIRFRVPVGASSFTPRVPVTVSEQGIALEVPAAWAEEFAATGHYYDIARTAGFETTVLTVTAESDVLPLVQEKQWPTMAEVERRQVGAYNWTFYEGPIGIIVAYWAVTQAEDGRFYAVLAIVDSTISDPEAVKEHLLLPALETFRLTSE